MKIYLAARFGRQEEMRRARAVIQGLGHEVTSSWLDVVARGTLDGDPEQLSSRAAENLLDLAAADTAIFFTEEPETRTENMGGWKSGGRHVELGFALCLSKMYEGNSIVLVGPRENIFCFLSGIQVFETFDHALSLLSTMPRRRVAR